MNVNAERLRDRTLALVEVESPTGDTADAARLYAGWCEELGLEVELLDDVFPATPTVVARLKGGEPGPSVVLNAHLDTVPIPHDPPRIEGDRDLRPRLGRHEGRRGLRARGGAGAEPSRARSRASSCSC